MTELLVVGRSDGHVGALCRALGRAEPTWTVRQVAGADAAMDYLSRRPAELLIAHLGELPQPYQSLFASALRQSPATLRIALLAHGAPQPRIANAHQCLTMRDEPLALHPALAAAVEVARCASERPAVAKLIAHLHDVPSPPTLYFDIREQLERPEQTHAATAQILARDPSLVARVLRIANSGFYALPRSVGDLADAIGMIGTDAVLGLVLAAHLYSGLPPPGLNLERLWQHTTQVSALARRIAAMEGADRHQQNKAALAGLLHDIGLLVLLENEPAQYQPLWHRSGGDESKLAQMERDTFGVTHGELGALILTLWMLPQDVVDAVANSHLPRASALALPSRAVLAAEWLLEHAAESELDRRGAPAPLNDVPAEMMLRWRAARDELSMGRAAN